MNARASLEKVFEADRAALVAEERLLEADPDTLPDVLSEAVEEALSLDDPSEAELRLVRLADLCAQVAGPAMCDALLDILDVESPRVRVEAGEALLDLAYARFKEVAQAIERALVRGRQGRAMQELPFVLIEIRDPDPTPLLARFLEHSETSVVAAAIEALAAFGDPEAGRFLEPFIEDDRQAPLEDLDDAPVTVGELALAALAELGIEM